MALKVRLVKRQDDSDAQKTIQSQLQAVLDQLDDAGETYLDVVQVSGQILVISKDS
jgi:hypothetical protein